MRTKLKNIPPIQLPRNRAERRKFAKMMRSKKVRDILKKAPKDD